MVLDGVPPCLCCLSRVLHDSYQTKFFWRQTTTTTTQSSNSRSVFSRETPGRARNRTVGVGVFLPPRPPRRHPSSHPRLLLFSPPRRIGRVVPFCFLYYSVVQTNVSHKILTPTPTPKERGFRFRVSLSETKKILSFLSLRRPPHKKKKKEKRTHDFYYSKPHTFLRTTRTKRLSFFFFLNYDRPGPRPERFVVIIIIHHHHGGVAGGGGEGSGTGTSGGACSRPPILVQSRLHVRLGPGERARRRDELVRFFVFLFLCVCVLFFFVRESSLSLLVFATSSSSEEDDDDDDDDDVERRKVVSRGNRRRRRRRRRRRF